VIRRNSSPLVSGKKESSPELSKVQIDRNHTKLPAARGYRAINKTVVNRIDGRHAARLEGNGTRTDESLQSLDTVEQLSRVPRGH
jgi:hypothetical protein